ncbi:MAG: hypothetical protein RIF36_11470 [Imperialibacter sp.]|uniref:hypothetical protein n=1 Tax=Imperialibacter sp. TaxID=2038411 RepID=UPI0032EFFD4E
MASGSGPSTLKASAGEEDRSQKPGDEALVRRVAFAVGPSDAGVIKERRRE